MSLALINACNLRCRYCFAGNGDYGKPGEMSLETAKAALSQLALGQKSFSVRFFGGEALLRWSLLKKIVQWCRSQETRFDFALTTNATLLSPRKLDFLSQEDFRLTISYDGKYGQELNRLDTRGKAATYLTDRLSSLRLNQLRSTTIRITVTRQSVNSFAKDISELLQNSSWKVAYALAAGQGDFASRLASVHELCCQLTHLVEKLLRLGELDKVLRLHNLRQLIIRLHHRKRRNTFCQAGHSYLSVSPEGSYYLCHRFLEQSESRIGSISAGVNRKYLDQLLEPQKNLAKPCQNCWTRMLCHGGCMHENQTTDQSSETDLNPVFCQLQRKESELAIRAYIAIKTVKPELLASL